MEFLDNLYSNNYFGIGLFAVIAFLVVTFLIVLFFGKKDAKKRRLSEIQNNDMTDGFKETSMPTKVEIPINPEPVAPINLEPIAEPTVVPQVPVVEPINTPDEVFPTQQEAVAPVNPVDPNIGTPTLLEKEEVSPVLNTPKVEPIISPVNYQPVEPPHDEPIISPEPISPIIPEVNEVKPINLEPTKIEVKNTPVTPIIPEEITPIIKEEPPKLQINEEPVINTYYRPTEKSNNETIAVPKIDFDSLAKSISKELDELEKDTKRYEEVKITPIKEVTKQVTPKEVYSSVHVAKPNVEPVKESIELPKRIDLPAKKGE